MIQKLLVLFWCTLVTPLFGNPLSNPDCSMSLDQMSEKPSGLSLVEDSLALFSNQKRMRAVTLNSLSLGHEVVDAGVPVTLLNGPSNRSDRGASNEGIFQVHLQNGESAVLKIILGNQVIAPHRVGATEIEFDGVDLHHPIFGDFLLIQRTLGEKGMAPGLIGVLPEPELLKLIERYRREAGSQLTPFAPGTSATGILMEVIPGAWNISKNTNVPGYLGQLRQEHISKILANILVLEATVNRLAIDAQDNQLFLSRDGRVMLGDLDDYRIARGSEEVNNFIPHMRKLIEYWELRSGQTYPRKLFYELTGRKKRREANVRRRVAERMRRERIQRWYREGYEPPVNLFHALFPSFP